tara:strand:- start:336 stop:593 length:258 start_codon:yes stop_codon:yes gene_type:complete
VPAFFGLTPNNKDFILEQIFNLMYYIGFSYRDAYRLPVYQRKWFIERVVQEIKSTNSSKGHNSNNQSEYSGKMRSQTPANLRRFT